MKKKRVVRLFLLGLLAVCAVWTLPIRAEEGQSIPEGFDAVVDSLPQEMTDKLPQGIWGQTVEEVDAALRALLNGETALQLIRDSLGIGLQDALSLLVRLCALLVLSAIFAVMRQTVSSESLGRAVSFCATCGIFSAAVELQFRQLHAVTEYFERFSSLLGGMIPVMGTVYAMGGNVSTATMGSATLYAFLGISQHLLAESVIPVSAAFTVMALCQGLSPQLSLRGFTSALRKTYTFFICLISTVLLAVLSGQSTLGAAADGTAARAGKLLASTVIPSVGGSVGEALRTVAASVGYLRSVVGICGIVFLLLLVLPTLCTLLLTRLAFLLSSGVAELLGCESESRLLSEMGNVWGCLIAAVAVSAVTFILAMTVFVRVAVAFA